VKSATGAIITNVSSSAAPPVTSRAEAARQAGEQLLREWDDAGWIASNERLEELCDVIGEVVEVAAQEDEAAAQRRERAQHWREQMPELAEAMLTGAPERWSASEIASTAAELGVNLSRVDVPAIAKERSAAPAYIGPFATHRDRLHRDLGIASGKPIPQAAIEAAAKRRDEVGQRARLAIKLLAMARSARP
jgi:hypothetical protein